MKPRINLLTGLLILATFSTQAKALQSVTIGGNGCAGVTGDQLLAPIAKDRYRIPAGLILQKDASRTIARSTCNFRIPIDLAPNERVIVRNLSQSIKLSADAQVSLKSQLDVTLVGASVSPIITQIKASKKSAKLSKTLKVNNIIVESGCGESAIIAGNLSVTANGAKKAAASLGDIDLEISIGRCL